MRVAAPRRVRSLRGLVSATALAVIAPLALSTVSAAAPAADPHPAAPIGGCAVTQDPAADVVSKPRKVTLQRKRTVVQQRRVKRVARGWRVALDSRVVWRGGATVDVTSTYASADCGVEEQRVQATHRRTSRVPVTLRRGATAPTRKAAAAEARKKVRHATRRSARARVIDLAREAALLKARTTFLDSLPTRDETVPTVEVANPAKQACPKRVATKATQKGHEAARREGTIVPQFDQLGTLWVCSYGYPKGVLTERRKVRGVDARRVLAGLRSLRLLPVDGPRACPSDIGGTTLVTHVTPAGGVTSVAVQRFGCHDARLTASAARVAPGTAVARGVPTGTFGSSPLLWEALSRLA